VHADPKPLSKEEQARVDKAIEKAVAYLKRMQTKEGGWPLHPGMRGWPLGPTLLPAYALLESGVPADDPVIRKAADFIRPRVLETVQTYEISLALLFLDRLGDAKDKPLIRSLAVRLIAGQHLSGGWEYRCPKVGKEQETVLLKALTALSERLQAGEKSRSKLLHKAKVPPALTSLPVIRALNAPLDVLWKETKKADEAAAPGIRPPGLKAGTDNSNTQFAMLGLWAAQRHGVPVDSTFRLMAARFEKSQLANGEWEYYFDHGRTTSTPSMICVGLMGLAIGGGMKLPMHSAPHQGRMDHGVLKGLAALSQDMGIAASGKDKPAVERGPYYLWSVERVAMLYDLPSIGDKDWYRWGAMIYLNNQRPGGEWEKVAISHSDAISGYSQRFGPVIDTSFALLFLKCSHPLKELTAKLPWKGKELNRGIARFLTSVPHLEPSTTTTTPSKSETPKR
jgi:hypothetical protein